MNVYRIKTDDSDVKFLHKEQALQKMVEYVDKRIEFKFSILIDYPPTSSWDVNDDDYSDD